MATRTLRVLLVEDSPADAGLIRHSLRSTSDQFTLEHVTHLAEAVSRLAKTEFDLVLLDLDLPDAIGLTACSALLERAPEVPLIILSGANDDELAIEAIALGAQDYLCKDRADRQQLVRSIRHALTRHARATGRLGEALPPRDSTLRPGWNGRTKELTFGGVLIKRLLRASENQERVLAAFQEEAWPPRIDDPLPPREGIDMKERLRATVRSLNGLHSQELIRFHADGTGTGFKWARAGIATAAKQSASTS